MTNNKPAIASTLFVNANTTLSEWRTRANEICLLCAQTHSHCQVLYKQLLFFTLYSTVCYIVIKAITWRFRFHIGIRLLLPPPFLQIDQVNHVLSMFTEYRHSLKYPGYYCYQLQLVLSNLHLQSPATLQTPTCCSSHERTLHSHSLVNFCNSTNPCSALAYNPLPAPATTPVFLILQGPGDNGPPSMLATSHLDLAHTTSVHDLHGIAQFCTVLHSLCGERTHRHQPISKCGQPLGHSPFHTSSTSTNAPCVLLCSD